MVARRGVAAVSMTGGFWISRWKASTGEVTTMAAMVIQKGGRRIGRGWEVGETRACGWQKSPTDGSYVDEVVDAPDSHLSRMERHGVADDFIRLKITRG
jgi:hypothetical protein